MKELIELDEDQFYKFQNGITYINKSGNSFILLCELNRYWKEFFFDLLSQLKNTNAESITTQSISFYDLKKHYKDLIIDYNLSIDIKDYIELNDYVSFDEWIDLGNDWAVYEDKYFLIKEI